MLDRGVKGIKSFLLVSRIRVLKVFNPNYPIGLPDKPLTQNFLISNGEF